MRFICFHGAGTNAKVRLFPTSVIWEEHFINKPDKVFENQTGITPERLSVTAECLADDYAAASLRQALGRDHEFLFINGTVQTDPIPGT